MKSNKRKNLELITPTTLIVGVDGHAKSNTAAFVLASGMEPVKPLKFSNSHNGFELLLDKVNKIKKKNGLDNVIFILEPNGPYWLLLAHYLCERKHIVKVVGALQVKRNRQTDDPSPEKNDIKDARSAADLGRQGKFNGANLLNQIYENLRTLTRLRDGLLEQRSQNKHRLRAALVRCFPEFSSLFSDLCGKGAVGLLRVAPTAESVVSLGVDAVNEVLKESSSGRLGIKKAKAVVECAKVSVGYAVCDAALKLEFDVLLDTIDNINQQIEKIESMMQECLEQTVEARLLLSIPGVGKVIAAGILGETGGLLQFDNPGQIRKLAGFDLVGQQSGNHQSQMKISKRGRKLLRKLLYQCVVSCLHCCSVFRNYYDGLIREGRRNCLKKKQAIVATCGKLIDVILSLVKSNKMFDPDHQWMPAGKCSEVLSAA